jgi:hypothetical protein
MIHLLKNYIIKEHFTNISLEVDNDSDNDNDKNTLYTIISLIKIICSFIAAGLSWRCNTKSNYPFEVKLVCALNALFWGWIYIVFYFGLEFNKICSKYSLVELSNKSQESITSTSNTSNISNTSNTSITSKTSN